jgi:hypothetical protein
MWEKIPQSSLEDLKAAKKSWIRLLHTVTEQNFSLVHKPEAASTLEENWKYQHKLIEKIERIDATISSFSSKKV